MSIKVQSHQRGLRHPLGSILEVDGHACVVKYLIAGDPGEPEVWAILLLVTPITRDAF